MVNMLFDYIANCPTPYQAVAHTASVLSAAGYLPLNEAEDWNIEAGRGYYVTRNGSSLIAFRVPSADFAGFMVTASHCDSPCFKIKENSEICSEDYVLLSTERYGGMLCASWMDRPLSVAGRVVVRTAAGVETRLVDLHEPCAIIPNVAIHMNRNANDGMSYNAAVDMLPLYACGGGHAGLRARVAEALGVAGEDIAGADLFVYNPQPGAEWNGLISAPRLDDLQCAFACLQGFLSGKNGDSVGVYCLFDNEEVGSATKQGAASPFLKDVLRRVSACCGKDKSACSRSLANSFMLSCDNAHAVHPNHGEYADKNHSVYMNKGIVIKYNAQQKYTSDAVSAAIFRGICRAEDIPCQSYANRADMPGGSTLGNISNTQVALNTVDIGLAQLAMHSAYETAGALDTQWLIKAVSAFYGKTVIMERDGAYRIV